MSYHCVLSGSRGIPHCREHLFRAQSKTPIKSRCLSKWVPFESASGDGIGIRSSCSDFLKLFQHVTQFENQQSFLNICSRPIALCLAMATGIPEDLKGF